MSDLKPGDSLTVWVISALPEKIIEAVFTDEEQAEKTLAWYRKEYKHSLFTMRKQRTEDHQILWKTIQEA
jgi:TusA-related sulfurtransferase